MIVERDRQRLPVRRCRDRGVKDSRARRIITDRNRSRPAVAIVRRLCEHDPWGAGERRLIDDEEVADAVAVPVWKKAIASDLRPSVTTDLRYGLRRAEWHAAVI